MKYKCLFLDRDGVINYDYGHVGTKDRFKFKPGIFNLIKKANNLVASIKKSSEIKKKTKFNSKQKKCLFVCDNS